MRNIDADEGLGQAEPRYIDVDVRMPGGELRRIDVNTMPHRAAFVGQDQVRVGAAEFGNVPKLDSLVFETENLVIIAPRLSARAQRRDGDMPVLDRDDGHMKYPLVCADG